MQLFFFGKKYLFENMFKVFQSSVVAQMVKNLPAMQETWVPSLGSDDHLEKGAATHSSFLPGEFHGVSSSAGYRAWGYKQLDMTE